MYYAKCPNLKYLYAKCLYAKCYYTKCHNAKCLYDKCNYTKCPYDLLLCQMSLQHIPNALLVCQMSIQYIPNVIHHANMANFILTNVALPTVVWLHVIRLNVAAPIASYDESRSSGIDKNVASVVFSQNRPWQRLGGLCQG